MAAKDVRESLSCSDCSKTFNISIQNLRQYANEVNDELPKQVQLAQRYFKQLHINNDNQSGIDYCVIHV